MWIAAFLVCFVHVSAAGGSKCLPSSPPPDPVLCQCAGMRGAFGKALGTCARVNIGQILLSIRCKDTHAATAEEALRRAKFKFPGRQKIVASRNWGFTPYLRSDYVLWKKEGRLINDGINVKVRELNNARGKDCVLRRHAQWQQPIAREC